MRTTRNKYSRFGITLFLLSQFTFLGCTHDLTHRDGTQEKPSGPAAAVQTTEYHATGVVKALDPNRHSIEIDHEEIKGLMPAMKMEFHIKDNSILDGLAVDDKVEFTIEHSVGGLRIIAIKKR